MRFRSVVLKVSVVALGFLWCVGSALLVFVNFNVFSVFTDFIALLTFMDFIALPGKLLRGYSNRKFTMEF